MTITPGTWSGPVASGVGVGGVKASECTTLFQVVIHCASKAVGKLTCTDAVDCVTAALALAFVLHP